MVTTVTRAVPRPALRTSSLITSVVLLVILSLPVAPNLAGERETAPLPSEGVANGHEDGADSEREDSEAHGAAEEVRPYLGSQAVALGPPASTCDQRSVLRDLPDAVPSCALRLAVWDQPWWPLPLPHHKPAVGQADAEGLPPTRGPPLTALTIV
ncbi:hypothetical protein [Nocardiopsis oceani]